MIVEFGNPQGSVLVHGDADRAGEAGTGGCGRLGDEIGLAEHAIRCGTAGLAGGVIEAEHTVVGEIPHPHPSLGIEADADGIVEFGGIRAGGFAGEIALAEDGLGRRSVGQIIGRAEAQNAVVGAIDDKKLAADRVYGHAIGAVEVRGIGAGGTADKVGLAEDQIGGFAVAPLGHDRQRQQDEQRQ